MTESNSRPEPKVFGAFLLAILIAGANVLAVRFTVSELEPFWGAVLRFSPAAVIFWLIAAWRRDPIPRGRTLGGLMLYGALSVALSYGFLYWGLTLVPAGLGSIVGGLVPLLTLLLATAHRQETFHYRAFAGSLLALSGIGLAFLQPISTTVPWAGLLALLAGAACVAESTVILKQFPGATPVMTNAVSLTVGTALLVPISLLLGETWQLPQQAATWAAVLYLITIGSVLIFYLFVVVVRRWTASAASYLFVLAPFVTIALSWWLASEEVSAGLLAGAALVVGGVYTGALRRTRPADPASARPDPGTKEK
ncbi:MAG: EamA family transporter [Anaerolineales bacterium]|nr:EamA family transporter [Anaerolineales bacterium]